MSGNSLKSLHIGAACLHAVSCAASIVVLSSRPPKATLPLTYTSFGKCVRLANCSEIKYLVPIFPALSCINHVLSVVSPTSYEAVLNGTSPNLFRWSEYAVSAGVMTYVLARLSGESNVGSLCNLVVLNAAMQFCGYMAELTEDTDTAQWQMMGWILFVSIWGQISSEFYLTLSDKSVSVPTLVYCIIWIELALFLSFGIVSLYFKSSKDRKSREKREMAYLILSFVSKTTLTWMLVGGALNVTAA